MKTKVSMLGQQLLRARPADTRLRERLDQIETDWLRLMCDLPNNEEALHSAQMELLPSRQALGELGLWMNAVEATLRDDNRDYCSLLDVQMALEKYRVRYSPDCHIGIPLIHQSMLVFLFKLIIHTENQ